MKITKCNVKSFGVLKNFSVDFCDGLNTVKEDNGWGKSTLTVFIKAMFYGLSDSKRNIADNERIRFRPWGTTERFGGDIEFEHKGKKFKIERFFGNKESDDTYRLTDIASGKVYDKIGNLGEKIFDIDEEGFFSTAYFSQKDFEIKSNSSITAKFNNLSGDNDSDALNSAVKKIDEKAKLIKGRAEKGLFYDVKRQLFNVNDKIETLSKVSDTLSFVRNELKSVDSEVERLKTEGEVLAEKVAVAGKSEAEKVKRDTYLSFLKEREDFLHEKKEYEKVFNGSIPDMEKINRCITSYKEIFDLQEKENSLSRDIAAMETEKKDVINQSNKPDRTCIIYLVLSVLFLTSGLIVTVLSLIPKLNLSAFIYDSLLFIVGSILLFSGVVFLILFIFYFKKRKKYSQVKLDDIEHKLTVKKDVFGQYASMKSRYEKAIEIFLNSFNLPDHSDIFSSLSFLKETLLKYDRCVSLLKANSENIEKYKTAITSNDLKVISSDINILREKLKDTQTQYTLKTNDRANRLATISKYEQMLDALPELLNEKERLKEKASELEHEYNILSLTNKYLNEADENLKTKYREPLEKSFNKYLSKITNDVNFEAEIDVKSL